MRERVIIIGIGGMATDIDGIFDGRIFRDWSVHRELLCLLQ